MHLHCSVSPFDRPGIVAILLSTLFFFIGCDHGISPTSESVEPGFGGTIRVISPWPPADSIRDLRVVAFRNYPPQNILVEVSSGNAVFSDSTLTSREKIIPYKIQQSKVTGTFQYVVLAQQYGSNVFTDWRAVGVYSPTNDPTKPGSITVPQNTFLPNIDITVDFTKLPPQTF